MRQFTIINLYSDMACEYDRVAKIRDAVDNKELTVHFIEYDEYLEDKKITPKRKQGDLITGNVNIDLISYSRKEEKELIHNQSIPFSPHIEAIIEVSQIIDKFTLIANTSIISEHITINFEDEVDYRVGDKVLVNGSLELCDIV